MSSFLALLGCSTLASKERLENQNQLLILELKNQEHAQDGLKAEIENLKLLLSQTEQKLSELSQSADDKVRAFDELNKTLTLVSQKRSDLEKSCQTLVEQVKTGLSSGRLNNKSYRQQLLESLNQWQSDLGDHKALTTTHEAPSKNNTLF